MYSTEMRAEYRLTPAQVDALEYAYGEDGAGMSPEARAILSTRTLNSLVKRGLLTADYALTPLGADVLYCYS